LGHTFDDNVEVYMKNKMFITSLLAGIVLASCTPTATIVPAVFVPTPTLTAIPTIIVPTPTHTAIPTPTIPISQSTITVKTKNGTIIEPYQDVRFQDVTALDGNLGESMIETLWFNESTKWSEQDQRTAENILKLAMNPGLGIRDLHAEGITGKRVNVAIIDQNMVLDHPEFQGKIVKYYDVGTNAPSNEGSMHGPAVTSLLVGENIGTAPGANVYYVAAPSWTADAQYYADALNWIVNENEKLPEGDKIRVVSVSAAPSGRGSPFTRNNAAWDAAYQRATEAGILVLDCTINHGITAPCHYDLYDPDNIAKCTPGFPGEENHPMPDRIYIPTSMRTTAEEYQQGVFSYQYTGLGGLSWSVPYLAGVLALGWQVRPDLTGTQLLDILYRSAYITDGGLKIINPGAFIDMVR
jgi:serine protease AprX